MYIDVYVYICIYVCVYVYIYGYVFFGVQSFKGNRSIEAPRIIPPNHTPNHTSESYPMNSSFGNIPGFQNLDIYRGQPYQKSRTSISLMSCPYYCSSRSFSPSVNTCLLLFLSFFWPHSLLLTLASPPPPPPPPPRSSSFSSQLLTRSAP